MEDTPAFALDVTKHFSHGNAGDADEIYAKSKGPQQVPTSRLRLYLYEKYPPA